MLAVDIVVAGLTVIIIPEVAWVIDNTVAVVLLLAILVMLKVTSMRAIHRTGLARGLHVWYRFFSVLCMRSICEISVVYRRLYNVVDTGSGVGREMVSLIMHMLFRVSSVSVL